MDISVNLTVRIRADLKVAAEVAAADMDTTLSRVVREAFRELVNKAELCRIRKRSVLRSALETAQDVAEMNARMVSRQVQDARGRGLTADESAWLADLEARRLSMRNSKSETNNADEAGG